MSNKKFENQLKQMRSKWCLGINDRLTYGKYKNCRIGYVINLDPEYLQFMIHEHDLQITNEAKRELQAKLEWSRWTEYLLK